MAILNIGILAHVDAGKTSLTERILFETGVLNQIGSVDKGTTRTDTLELERARGITIRSTVVSFRLDGLKVNLIDTPGHSDFIAEVERSLSVLDAVVLVVSAVEGVQSQTRRLARAIRDAGLPMLIFVNKVDRVGARTGALLAEIRNRLDIQAVPMNHVSGAGDRAATAVPVDRHDPAWREQLADALSEANEQVIEEFDRTGGNPGLDYLERELRRQVADGLAVPVYFGSAITGAGTRQLLDGVAEWLPPAAGPEDSALTASVFKITRQPSGEKIVFVRLFTGSLAVRDIATITRENRYGEIERIEERITGIDAFEAGATPRTATVAAGDIACIHGLRGAKIGDVIGNGQRAHRSRAFPTPKLESAVHPVDPGQITDLRTALEEMAEQDPLISLRQRNQAGEISVRLFGEVQKEVMADTLLAEYGIPVEFGESQVICIERPTGRGEKLERMRDDHPYYATVGLRVEPAPPGSGIRYERQLGALPLAFYRAIEETVYQTLEQGLHGWEVTDCAVTLTDVAQTPITTASDFRKVTPLALMEALQQAGTEVLEPLERLELEVPEDTYGAVCSTLINARGTVDATRIDGATCRITCHVPAAELQAVERQLPGLTRGEAGWDSTFGGYIPVPGTPPCRPRIGPDPLNRTLYLADVAQGVL